MNNQRPRLPAAAQIRPDLEEAIRHDTGEIMLKTTTLELLDRPPPIGASELTSPRRASGMSQAGFARLLSVSTKTVQAWQQDHRMPSQSALRLIQLFHQNAPGPFEIVGMSGPTGTPNSFKAKPVTRNASRF